MKLETFKLERWMSRWEMKVQYDIAESGVYPFTTRELLDLLPEEERAETLDTILDTRLGYTEARGTEALRTMIAANYENTTPDEILVTTGAIEANFLVMNHLLEAGDHVIAVSPAYQQLNSVPRAIGCDLSLWELLPEEGFQYNLAKLEGMIRPNTKMIIVNTPHNPTGSMLSEEQLRRIYTMAESVGAWLLCDEAYRWIEIPGGDEFAPPVRNIGPLGISIGTYSKPFGLPGLRLGWIAAPADVVAACWGMRDYVSLSPGKLNDYLGQVAMKHKDRIFARNRQIIEENLDTAETWFGQHADIVSWTPPRGGLLALMKVGLDVPSLEMSDDLAGDYSVMLAPGSAFGYEGHLRIGIGQRPDIFRTGLEQTSRYFSDVQKKGARRK